MRTKTYFLAKEELGRQWEGGMPQHLSQHCCRIQHPWGVAAMQAALEGVPVLQSCFSAWLRRGVEDLESQLPLPLGTGGLRAVKGSERRVTPHPMLCRDWTCFARPQP